MNLWKHQQEAVEAARSLQHMALFFDIGTGKTRTMIEILREDFNTRKIFSNTLILAPLSVCAQWKQQFQRFSKIKEDQIHVLTDTGAKRAKRLREIRQSGRPGVFITNYESLRIKAVSDALQLISPEIIICDESHGLKNPASARSKNLQPFAKKARRRFILTGTPMPNSMMDLFGQFMFLDVNVFGSNYFEFRHRYFRDKNAHMPRHIHFPDWQPKPEAAQMIAEKISSLSRQAKKSLLPDLPPLVDVEVPVPMSGKQAEVYASMRDNFIAELDGEVTVAEFSMTKTIRLRQILAGFILAEGESKPVWFDPSPKLDALSDLLENLRGNKVIVWTEFAATYDAIATVCGALKIDYRLLTGQQSTKQKEENIEAFCRGSVEVLVANPAAGGAGINIQEAPYSIYFDKGYSAVNFEQSRGRNHRAGSGMHERVTHYHLVTPDSLDEVISSALLRKLDLQEEVLKWALDISKRNTHKSNKKEPLICQSL